MSSFIDELTTAYSKSPPIIRDAVGSAKDYAVAQGGKLVDEQLGRTGLALSNAGPDAVAQLNAPKGSGNVSPNVPNIHNTQGSGFDGVMSYLKANWKLVAGVVVAGVGLWWVLKRKRK